VRVVPGGGYLLAVTLTVLLPVPGGREQPVMKTAAPREREKAARETLARLEKAPGWQERMRAFVSLTKAGPDAIGPLVEALHKGSPPNRAFAARVLGILASPAARPALEKALGDPDHTVRSQAILALRMLGPLKLTDQQRQALQKSKFHVRGHLEIALAGDEDLGAAATRKALKEYDPARIDTARIGQLAPDFSLADLSGKIHRLSRLSAGKGIGGSQPVVLVFLMIDH